MQRLQAATAAPVVVVSTAARREADEAAEALGGLGAQVCPARIGQRVAFARSLLDGRAAQEVEPGGKAADDVQRVHTFCLRTMKRRRMSNRFAAAVQTPAEPGRRPAAATRQGKKHVGAYVDPAIARQLRVIAAAEDSSVQQLVEEGIALVLQSRGK